MFKHWNQNKKCRKNNDVEQLGRIKLCHDTFVFLWAIDNPQATKHIFRSKSTSLTLKIFVDGTEEAYKHNLEREIDKLDCREILTQLSSSRLNSETANNIEEIDLEERKQREYTRNVQIGLID